MCCIGGVLSHSNLCVLLEREMGDKLDLNDADRFDYIVCGFSVFC